MIKSTNYTTAYRSNARDARTGALLNGEEAVRCYLNQTGDTARYISRHVWLERTTRLEAAAVVVGKPNNNRLTYQCVIETANPSRELHANMLAANGNAPLWYAIEGGYASPSFLNARWHKKLEQVFELLDEGTVTVLINDQDTGDEFTRVSIKGNRDELGRYIKAQERGAARKSPLLQMVDEATKERKGYSNY